MQTLAGHAVPLENFTLRSFIVRHPTFTMTQNSVVKPHVEKSINHGGVCSVVKVAVCFNNDAVIYGNWLVE